MFPLFYGSSAQTKIINILICNLGQHHPPGRKIFQGELKTAQSSSGEVTRLVTIYTSDSVNGDLIGNGSLALHIH